MEEQVLISLDTFTPATHLVLISGGHVTSIPFSEIVRVSKTGFHLQVFTASNSYSCQTSMEEILKELPLNRFARVHKSHILSLDQLHLLGGSVPFTPYYKKLLIRKLGRLLEQGYRNLYEPV